MDNLGQLLAVIGFGALALWFAAAVFRTASMVRSALALLFAMAALGGLFLTLEAEFLGVLQLMMMATEMAIMAIFMVMYMMDPGGLGQMEMTHQKRRALAAGALGGLAAAALVLLAGWGLRAGAAPAPAAQVHALGLELMERSMLIFETAGVTILVAMVAATAVAIRRRER
ncbi:MAG TPA: NADH-quinone oxidoreductase subunit J [Thermomicrobiales bacterium]|nr:NADH-quinone oxidoreductase subunit J [Thermomicrobiales bacterium]